MRRLLLARQPCAADYMLPSCNLKIIDAGVFWPMSPDLLLTLVGSFPFQSLHHRLVWIDMNV